MLLAEAAVLLIEATALLVEATVGASTVVILVREEGAVAVLMAKLEIPAWVADVPLPAAAIEAL